MGIEDAKEQRSAWVECGKVLDALVESGEVQKLPGNVCPAKYEVV